MVLEFNAIIEIHEKAISVGLQGKRDQLLFGINTEYVASLPDVNNPAGQLLSDLNEMNRDGEVIGGVPLERWLRNAAYATSTRPEKQRFFREKADEAKGHFVAPENRAQPGVQSEKILFISDMLPIGFLAGAARIGQSVARMIVPRFENAVQRNLPTSNQPILAYGTGWLIGPKHVITNYHVINARGDGEAPAAQQDFELQALSLEVQFDYDSEAVAGEKFKSVKLVVSNSELDYVILELEREPGRPAIPLWAKAIDFTEGARLPVNIIQHPGGQPKQMAIRNNLAAKLQGTDLAYYTDTKAGSSGSAVCNDRWQALALHKAATMTMGKFNFQGKETAWVNVGTTMEAIVTDLKGKPDNLWTSIRAVLV